MDTLTDIMSENNSKMNRQSVFTIAIKAVMSMSTTYIEEVRSSGHSDTATRLDTFRHKLVHHLRNYSPVT
ncbi:hypothetical protein J6590_006454 [Homalodisca vitripennis]|nr:hypothetical protein J6590_006454 [Homalodisca vitripennis]